MRNAPSEGFALYCAAGSDVKEVCPIEPSIRRRLSAAEVATFAVGDPKMSARASGAYWIPLRRAADEVS
jgi:hypothetical protein